MRVNLLVPSVRYHITSSHTYRRATAWLDENSDWCWMPVAALIALLLAFMFATSLPLPPVWNRLIP